VVDGGGCGEDHQIGTRSHHGVVMLLGGCSPCSFTTAISVAGRWGAVVLRANQRAAERMRRHVDRGGSFDPGMIAEQNGSVVECNTT